MKRKLLFFMIMAVSFGYLSYLLIPLKPVHAQDTYTCSWNPTYGCMVQEGCDNSQGYYIPPEGHCGLRGEAECNGEFGCISGETPTAAPTPTPSSVTPTSTPIPTVSPSEPNSYTCQWQAWSSSCQRTEENCDEGFIAGSCPDNATCSTMCVPPNACAYSCIEDTLPVNYYACWEHPTFGCMVLRDRCDDDHYVGSNCQSPCPTGYQECEEATTEICDIAANPEVQCGIALCQCPSPYECRQVGAGDWRCRIPPRAGNIFCPIDGDPEGGINTALGCIPVDPSGFTPWVIGLGIIAASGVAFLLMLYAGLQIIIASGDPGKLQAGKELLTAAISGLLLIIFAIFLLRVVGVEVFGIPGL